VCVPVCCVLCLLLLAIRPCAVVYVVQAALRLGCVCEIASGVLHAADALALYIYYM